MYSKFNFDLNRVFTIEDFLEIMEILRSPNGCAWDKEQTHKSIRREFLEETYEAIEAIDTEDTELLKEELGDVLLQIVFHCQIEKELSHFDFGDIVDGICKKLIVRHPHVFSDTKVNSTDDILSNWDKIKIETKGQQDIKENIESISVALPALMRYQKFAKKANKYNFKNLVDECNISLTSDNLKAEDIGLALAEIVSLAEKNGIDAEQALAQFTKNSIKNI